jgi:hypothetical protein
MKGVTAFMLPDSRAARDFVITAEEPSPALDPEADASAGTVTRFLDGSSGISVSIFFPGGDRCFLSI